MSAHDEKWMSRALALARRGRGSVHPNPMVGCVLVKGNRVVGEGFHQKFGEAHAEVNALKRAGTKAKGATAYVSLEPCLHQGKTPPCTEALIAAGVKRVVAAMEDPNPLVSGKGFQVLRRRRVTCESGVLENDARYLNRAFVRWITDHRPFITLKSAMTLDGKIATSQGDSKWITTPESRRRSHELRAEVDAIAVGVETARTDNPSLTAHGHGKNPVRIVFDSRLRCPIDAEIFSKEAPTWIFTTATDSAIRKRAYEKKGAVVFETEAGPHGRVSIKAALKQLGERGVIHLLVEGGGTLNGSFVEERLVDEVWWFIAPKIVGGREAPTAVGGRGLSPLSSALEFESFRTEAIGPDLFLHAQVLR